MARLRYVRVLALIFLSLVSASCSSLVTSKQEGGATEYNDRCVPLAAKRASHGATPVSAPIAILPSGLARTRFSDEALRLADVMGVVPLLNELTELTAQGKQESVEMLLRRQQLTDRILLTLLELASATAEIVCERDRADQLADRMDETDGTRIKGLTIASIVIGGLTSIVSGGIGLAGGATVAGDAANVGGGTLSSLFGVTALFTHSEVEQARTKYPPRIVGGSSQPPNLFPDCVAISASFPRFAC